MVDGERESWIVYSLEDPRTGQVKTSRADKVGRLRIIF